MMNRRVSLMLFFTVLSLVPLYLCAQSIDSSSFSLLPRQSFYSYEKEGELLLHVPESLVRHHLKIGINSTGRNLVSWEGTAERKILRLQFAIDLPPGTFRVESDVIVSGVPGKHYIASTDLVILSYKSNEVKTDRLTGRLIVNKLPFFPFGFYCYSPVYPSLPEEEIVKGFNVISPYQKIAPETISERQAYMDRCAELGMKVHYNLLSVSGGGGVGSKIDGLDDKDKRERLINEIKTFRDHPALLGWYISDEPDGKTISPEVLKEIYTTIKENDPWHPVSVVFMAPFLNSKKYAEALDIVMADPYPVPDLPVTFTGETARQLTTEFAGRKPVWIVPQAFGGGELWSREPTVQEIRSMTWQAIINGATGIQYFVRQGLNYFPKSTATWGECGRMAVEVAELTPWLLSDEESLKVESSSGNVLVTSRTHNNKLIVMAVNKINEPVRVSLRIKGTGKGQARVLFENRMVSYINGVITDQLSPLGTEVYLIDKMPENMNEKASATNLIRDDSFEDLSAPGLPSACYARPGGDRGATFFLDSRDFIEGNHSLRIITPVDNKSLAIRFFPFYVSAGTTYTISVWAKADPEQRYVSVTKDENTRLIKKEKSPQYVEISLGDFGKARFIPDIKWRQYITFLTVPADTLARFRTNLILKMPGQGVAWFDKVKVVRSEE